MNLQRLAIKNVWQNRGRYLAYLGSAAFAVMIYFLYTALQHHPYLQEGYRGARFGMKTLEVSAVIIAVFTLLFLLYSSAAFIRSRMKEFGLFTLLGLTRRQLIRVILWENLIIGTVALGVGLALGLLFLKLFFMAISVVLRLPEELPVYTAWPVWRQTILVFGSFFLFVSLLSLSGVLRRNIIELIRAERQPKANPTFSIWLALLGSGLLFGGYTWAASLSDPGEVITAMLPVTVMVCAGTFLMMREGSIALLRWLHRRHRFFYRTRPFLTISQLTFKMQDNYRVLTAVSLLIAVILTAVGTIFSLYVLIAEDAVKLYPQAIQIVNWEGKDLTSDIAWVQETLDRHEVTGLERVSGTVLRGTLEDARGLESMPVEVLPYSVYSSLYRPKGKIHPLADDQHGILVYRAGVVSAQDEGDAMRGAATLTVGDSSMALEVVPDISGTLHNGIRTVFNTVVVADTVFEQLLRDYPEAVHLTFAAWSGKDWNTRNVRSALEELRERYTSDEGELDLTATSEYFYANVNDFGMVLFIAVFVSLVFFAASCSLLYFRLFTEIDEDRHYYSRLQELGLSGRELRRLARGPAAVIFFVPFIVGLLHSTFAMNALGILTGRSVLHLGWMVACGYLFLYAVYFAATYALYWRTLRLEPHARAAA